MPTPIEIIKATVGHTVIGTVDRTVILDGGVAVTFEEDGSTTLTDTATVEQNLTAQRDRLVAQIAVIQADVDNIDIVLGLIHK